MIDNTAMPRLSESSTWSPIVVAVTYLRYEHEQEEEDESTPRAETHHEHQ